MAMTPRKATSTDGIESHVFVGLAFAISEHTEQQSGRQF
jgi:hypothetical protein